MFANDVNHHQYLNKLVMDNYFNENNSIVIIIICTYSCSTSVTRKRRSTRDGGRGVDGDLIYRPVTNRRKKRNNVLADQLYSYAIYEYDTTKYYIGIVSTAFRKNII